MSLQLEFEQSQLIQATGSRYPEGVCLGLVVQWLSSISENKEKTFWEDLNGSLADTPDVPLLGRGYARKAIEFQGAYINDLPPNASTGEFAKSELLKADLRFDNAISGGNAFSEDELNRIAARVLTNDCRYFVFGIRGNGGHAIGIYRTYSLIGKSTKVQIFDPNIGKYACDGSDEIKTDLVNIGNQYNGGLHQTFILEGYC
jgi:hypothetical protein